MVVGVKFGFSLSKLVSGAADTIAHEARDMLGSDGEKSVEQLGRVGVSIPGREWSRDHSMWKLQKDQ